MKSYFASWKGWLTAYFVLWIVGVLTIGSVFADVINLILVFIFLLTVWDILKGILRKNDQLELKRRGKQNLTIALLLFVGVLIIAAIISPDGSHAANVIGLPTVGIILCLIISGIICLVRGKSHSTVKIQ